MIGKRAVTSEMDSSRYIKLLKRSLIDFRNIGSSEPHPLAIVDPNWRTAFLYPIDRLLHWRNFTICKLKPVLEKHRLGGQDWPANAMTMIGMARLDNIEWCMRAIQRDGIPGDMIETGIWRGGAGIFMRAMLDELALDDRQVWLADSFEGLPVPDPDLFPADKGNDLHHRRILRVSLEEVKRNFRAYDLLDDRVRFLKGWFKDTLPKAPIERLALLRLDGDTYGSTITALDALYHKVSAGGFIIVDDYNAFPSCKQAVEDFRAAFGIGEPVCAIDAEAVFWRKGS